MILFGNKNRGTANDKFVRPVGRLDPVVEADVRNLLTGGREVPPDIDWTSVVYAGAGTGQIDFRCINGNVQFRGTLKVTQTVGGSYTGVRQFGTAHARYQPSLEMNFTAFAVDTGTTYRVGTIRITTSGSIGVSAPTGKFDTIQFDGLGYPVF